eukprot:scaffold53329_cov63-Attheya_sp.AAC.2
MGKIYEHPTAIELVDGPDCGPITCLEAVKYTRLALTADVNKEVVLEEVAHAYYCPLTFHYLGQMLKDCVYRNIFDYSMICVDTKDDKAVTDILGYRMKIVTRDFNRGWGIQPYKDLCQAEMCVFCREDIWEMSSSHAQFTCYVSCACTKRMHLSCFVKMLFSWDKMKHIQSPKKRTSYDQEPSLGRIFKCPACNQINDHGLLFVHHCDGSLITVEQLPCYPIEAHNQLPVLRIPHDERIRFVPRRRRWLREHIFPILWEEAKLRTYFNDESVPKSYFNLRTDGPVITSDNILLKADLVEEHDEVEELETKTKANDQSLTIDEESNIDQSKGGENGQSPSKTVEDEGYTTSQEQLNPGGSDTESEGTSKQTERVDPVIEPARKKNKGRQSTSSSGDAGGSDTETNIAKNASNKGTGQVDATNNPVTQQLTKKKRRRQRIRPRGLHVLGLEDDKDVKIVWDVYDDVPPDYCKKDDVNNLLRFY